jgi:hypothetical protein
MDGMVKIQGLESALEAMAAAFPADPKQQVAILNSALRGAANRTIVPEAKTLARAGDGSGALSEAIGVRNTPRKQLRSKGAPAGVQVTPVRSNRKAMALYIQHYYTSRGRNFPAKRLNSGIRHGHLVEFGSVNNQPARPFLYPAGKNKQKEYLNTFADMMRKRTEAAVKRQARRNGRRVN